jgi:hypothetical protein
MAEIRQISTEKPTEEKTGGESIGSAEREEKRKIGEPL